MFSLHVSSLIKVFHLFTQVGRVLCLVETEGLQKEFRVRVVKVGFSLV